MKPSFLMLGFTLVLVGCATGRPVTPFDSDAADTPSTPDTDAPDDTPEDTPAPTGDGPITGTWRSAGDDIADLFTASSPAVTLVVAVFEDGGGYTATVENEDDDVFVFEGTYTVDTGTTPWTISLSQATPYAASLEGLVAVDGDTLTYDVVDLSLGQPATPRRGFGSSSAGAANVQTYRRQ